VSDSVRVVAEETFNRLHGKVADIGSHVSRQLTAKGGHVGTLERVKLNLCESWNIKTIWESGAGWEAVKVRAIGRIGIVVTVFSGI
jgi:hypothetical protein